MSQYHFNPETYERLMAEEVPSYGRLQEEVAAATQGRRATRILDLGTGTGVTAQRVLGVHPQAGLVGIDENPQMLAKARGVLPADADLRVARLEGPLPRGPFDLVVSALAVHHLDGAAKADLFHRIAKRLAPGGRFVLGDLIIPADPRDAVTPIDGVHDKPSTMAEQLMWLRDAGFTPTTAWLERDLCVLIGDLAGVTAGIKRKNSPANGARLPMRRDGSKDRSRQSQTGAKKMRERTGRSNDPRSINMTSTGRQPSLVARDAAETHDGGGYYQAEGSHDARLTEVRRGTPMGELMRRYWHPVGLSSDASDLPRQIRILGEDLILFRDRKGRPGLVYPRCCHRGTSLLFGRVEEEGIRCCYHGWLYDREGHCLEQPAEPDSAVRRAKVRQPWYPVQERYGLVWAYLGPTEKRPVLPRYDVFEELQEGEFVYADDQNIGAVVSGVVPFNWLQHYENIHDPAHFYWLHYLHSGPQFGSRFGDVDLDTIRRELRVRVQAQTYEVNERGVTARRQVALPDGRILTTVLETVLPTLRVVPNPVGTEGPVDHVGFVLPVDDAGFRIYTVVRARDRRFSEFFGKRQASGEARTLQERQRTPGDLEAQGGQGPITLHSEEHLATSDRGIVMLRRLLETQLKIVEEGGDPIGVYFEEKAAYVRLAGGSFIAESPPAMDS